VQPRLKEMEQTRTGWGGWRLSQLSLGERQQVSVQHPGQVASSSQGLTETHKTTVHAHKSIRVTIYPDIHAFGRWETDPVEHH